MRLKDVAEIDDGLEDERSYSELNAKAGVSLEIRKQSGTNTVDIARAIKQELARLATEIPPDLEVTAVRDSSRFIESSVRDVSYDILLGIALVVVVTLCFLLSIRATLIVATAIPTALVATFFAFYLLARLKRGASSRKPLLWALEMSPPLLLPPHWLSWRCSCPLHLPRA